ncbi:CopG family transcriptional regulator [Acetobacteraceae bacterium ESL0709]|nr:CopG family transcriptional regulator [Acetobacteraceae bacterium ESL0697]MDF7677392.1 CopG family transcriptional regulator [Acetobacteraceae bacterium ESL0709]
MRPLASRFLWRYKTNMSNINSTIKSKKGRPKVDSEAVNVRLLRPALVALDDWRRAQGDLPNRAEAIRRLIQKGLEAEQEKSGKN